MNRGDVVIVAQKGVYEGKPRPVVVIQVEDLLDAHPSIVVCQLTSVLEAAVETFYRIAVLPTPDNGLKQASTILVDRIASIRRENIGSVVGRLDEATLGRLNTALALFLGLI